jgi:type IV pilus assembly protein PilY1
LSFSYDYGKSTFNPNDSTTQQVINQQPISTSGSPIPLNFLFGFGASTGGGTNVHEITCFEASPSARTIGAPVAPLTVSSGSLLYTLTSNPSPVQGFVNAYALSSTGTPATSSTWEAGSLMTDSTRSAALYSTASNGSSVSLLTGLDATAFALSSPSTCVPDTSTIVNYTIDPNTTYSPTPSGCLAPYLGTRAVGSLLDEFSPGDAALLMSPPNSPLDLALPNYTAYATAESSRSKALLFSNDDGFLYSVNASSGVMNWGWMPRSFVGQLQNYTTWPYQDNFAGNFAVTDASITNAGATSWGTYIIGSANGGALWYDLALNSQGNPATVVTTFLPTQATMPANSQALPGGTLAYPQRQAPVVGNIGGSQIAAFIVNSTSGTTTTSTLYEFNVATGASNSVTIPTASIGNGYVTSNLFYDADSGELFFGTSTGSVYLMSFTGSASTDVGNIGTLGTTEDGLAVQFVGYQQIKNLPYLWATSKTGLTVFGINNVGWNPLWATTANNAYTYKAGVWTLTTSGSPAALQSGATISDLPIVVNGVLVVPTFVAPGTQTCNSTGEGFYDFFSLQTGTFPQNTIQQNGQYLTGNLDLGQGSAYTPSYSISGTGLPVYGSTQHSPNPINPLVFSRSGINTVVQWRVH